MKRLSFAMACCAIFLLAIHSPDAEGGEGFDRAVERLSDELVRRADISGRQVIVSPHSFYDAENGMSLPLALNLKAALVRGLTKNNVTVLSPGPDQLEYSRIRGSWIKEKSELFRFHVCPEGLCFFRIKGEQFRIKDKGFSEIPGPFIKIGGPS